jgi:ribonuclease Z
VSAELEVVFLGTGGSAPSASRAPLALLVRSRGEAVLVDCGEGCARQLLASDTALDALQGCLITHLHADHYLGLPGLLAVLADVGRRSPLRIVGPHGLEHVAGPLARAVGRLPFALDLLPVTQTSAVTVGAVRALAFPVEHVGRAFGYAFLLGGRVGIVISGDTRPCTPLEQLAQRAHLLVHEATFCDDEQERALEVRHSTAREAAMLAARTEVELLALVHVSSRHPPTQALREARSVFPATKLPRDLDQALVTEEGVSWLPRRRAPVLVSGSGRSAR